jgi:putative oxidoreductase
MTTDTVHMPPQAGLVPQFQRLRALAERIPMSLLQLLARGGIAVVFWRSAQTKLANWDLTVALFRDEYRVPVLPPELAAPIATAFELACPVLLVLGLATRLATLPLIGMTLVIQIFVYPTSWPDHLIWTALLLSILARGPGALSLDHGIARLFAQGRSA